jgi:ectoine hydroxylase-related dioxygenase (phytanoyl-CoA dioxygenase family)
MGHRRRLRALVAHTANPAAQVQQEVGDAYDVAVGRSQGGALGFPLARQDNSGQLTAESVAELTAAMTDAAARLDFRTAANLQTMLKVLGPKPAPVPLSAFTSDDADTAADILLEQGFVILPDLISGDDLQRMRAAYEATAANGFPEEESWANGTERKDLGKYFSFDMFSESGGDPAYYALADPPLLMNVMHRALGRPVPFQGSGGRVLPVVDDEQHSETGYISWHRDISNGVANDNWPYPFGRSIKVSTFLYDVPENGGCLTFVPGSHRLPNAPQQTLDGTFAGGRGHYRKPLREGQGAVPGSHDGTGSSPNGAGSFYHTRKGVELPRGYDEEGVPLWVAEADDLQSVEMPNCVRCAVPAGSFVIFDTCIWHVAIPNTSSQPRVGTIAGFNAGSSAASIPPAHLAVLESEGRMTAQRKAAFGLEMSDAEAAEVEVEEAAAAAYVKRRTGGNAN